MVRFRDKVRVLRLKVRVSVRVRLRLRLRVLGVPVEHPLLDHAHPALTLTPTLLLL